MVLDTNNEKFSISGETTRDLDWPSIIQSISTSTGSAKAGFMKTIDIENNKIQNGVNI